MCRTFWSKLCDFLGHSDNAVRRQVWIALLLYVLLRYQAFLHAWPHSFTRLFTLLLAFSGTAAGPWRMRAQPEQGYLPGLAPAALG